MVKGGGEDMTRSTGQVKRGDIDSKRKTVNLQALKAEQVRAEVARLEQLKQKVEQKIAENPKLAAMKSQIRLDMTADGLRIQIVDENQRPMFSSGSAVVQPYMRELLREIGTVLAEVPNRLTLEGHTDAAPFVGGGLGYGNWELSADRANASRRELMSGGLPEDRMLRVQGLAASLPFDAKDPHERGQPAHQHHRDEPRGRGPHFPQRQRGAGAAGRRRTHRHRLAAKPATLRRAPV